MDYDIADGLNPIGLSKGPLSIDLSKEPLVPSTDQSVFNRLVDLINNEGTIADIESLVLLHPHIARTRTKLGHRTLLHVVCTYARRYGSQRSADIATVFIQAGCNVDACDTNSYTPLMRAICKPKIAIELFAVLMASSPDVNLKNKDGLTALHLHYYSQGCDYRIVQPIFDAGFSINNKTTRGATILMMLVNRHNMSDPSVKPHIRTMLDRNISVNAQDARGDAALHSRLLLPNSHLVKLLIKAGANVNICNNSDETPIMLCYSNYPKYRKTIRLLKRAGATDKPGYLTKHNTGIDADMCAVM